ncbi:MAG: hypothetical protein IAB93_01015 [Bacteroidetes bacterium]|uniref:Uncharacterized protein n=1 Tax=Candidatus Merdivivens pullistercoris TaxID=2840873 RepID=A0A9D9I3V4_9BACT|nr:hypothetical protein [Candidatus Merdivivens pullistercoris]
MKRTVITISAIAAVLFSVVMIVMAQTEPVPGKDGNRYVPYEQRTGNDRYILIDLDNGGKRITPQEAVKGLKPFVQERE